jgi:Lar family restriction alleviation protein
MSETLKPCPFCAGEGAVSETEDHLGRLWPVVRCQGCGAEVIANDAPNEAEATAAWNRRPTPGEDKPLGIEEVVVQKIYANLHHLMRVTGAEAQTAYETAARSIIKEIAAIEAYEQARASTPPPLGTGSQ